MRGGEGERREAGWVYLAGMVKRNIKHVIDKEYGTKAISSRRDEAPLQCYLRMEEPITITRRARLSCFLHSPTHHTS